MRALAVVCPVIRDVLRSGAGARGPATRRSSCSKPGARSGASRLDRDLDGRVDDAGAAIMDAAWPRPRRRRLSPGARRRSSTGWPPLETRDDAASRRRQLVRRRLVRLRREGPARAAGPDGARAVRDAVLRERGAARRAGTPCGPRSRLQARKLAAAQGPDPAAWRADAARERIQFGFLPDTARFTNRPTFQQVMTFSAPPAALTLRIVLAPDYHELADELRGRIPAAEVVVVDRSELPAALRGADAVVTDRLTVEDIARADRLRLVQAYSAGADRVDRAALPSGCTLCNLHGPENAIAEWALGAMVALTRRIVFHDRELRRGVWHRGEEQRPHELRGQVVGAVGYGPIGRRVAELSCAIGMQAAAVTRTPSSARAEGLRWLGGLDEVTRLAGDCDFVVAALPLTDETRGLIGAAELAALGPDGHLRKRRPWRGRGRASAVRGTAASPHRGRCARRPGTATRAARPTPRRRRRFRSTSSTTC